MLANKFSNLPVLHETDLHEVVHAIHVIQNKLFGRPAYRRYLALAQGTQSINRADRITDAGSDTGE